MAYPEGRPIGYQLDFSCQSKSLLWMLGTEILTVLENNNSSLDITDNLVQAHKRHVKFSFHSLTLTHRHVGRPISCHRPVSGSRAINHQQTRFPSTVQDQLSASLNVKFKILEVKAKDMVR